MWGLLRFSVHITVRVTYVCWQFNFTQVQACQFEQLQYYPDVIFPILKNVNFSWQNIVTPETIKFIS